MSNKYYATLELLQHSARPIQMLEFQLGKYTTQEDLRGMSFCPQRGRLKVFFQHFFPSPAFSTISLGRFRAVTTTHTNTSSSKTFTWRKLFSKVIQ